MVTINDLVNLIFILFYFFKYNLFYLVLKWYSVRKRQVHQLVLADDIDGQRYSGPASCTESPSCCEECRGAWVWWQMLAGETRPDTVKEPRTSTFSWGCSRDSRIYPSGSSLLLFCSFFFLVLLLLLLLCKVVGERRANEQMVGMYI